MSSKVANLIALELAILIAILAWLAFSNWRSVRPQPVAPEPKRTADSFATLAPVLRSANQRRRSVDYPSDPGDELRAEEAQPAQGRVEYEEAIATETYTSPNLSAAYFSEPSPYYDMVEPEPVLTSPDCLFSPLDQFVVYPQSSAIIVFSNSRCSGRRPRSPVRPGPSRPMVHRRPPTLGQSHLPSGRAAPRQNAHFRPSGPNSRLVSGQIP